MTNAKDTPNTPHMQAVPFQTPEISGNKYFFLIYMLKLITSIGVFLHQCIIICSIGVFSPLTCINQGEVNKNSHSFGN